MKKRGILVVATTLFSLGVFSQDVSREQDGRKGKEDSASTVAMASDLNPDGDGRDVFLYFVACAASEQCQPVRAILR
jgi:hypothetical protein